MQTTLYKKTKNKVIQKWTIRRELNKIIIAEGLLHGVQTEYSYLAEGKNIGKANETSPEQQAELEIQSRINKKLDQGYVEIGLSDLYTLPDNNTDASGNVKPMLAEKYSLKYAKYPALAQPKLDGARCLGFEETSNLISRNGKSYNLCIHIKEELKKLPSGTILDGELYSDELNFQQIMSAIKKYDSINTPKVKYRVYDLVSDEVQHIRLAKLQSIIKNGTFINISLVETMIIQNEEELFNYDKENINRGYEGTMLRNSEAEYESGFRSKNLLKVKIFDENEFTFKYFEFGQRGVEDLIAVIDINGLECKAKMSGTLSDKINLVKNETSLQGELLTVKYFGYTNDKLLRFPIGKGFRNYE